MRKKKLIIARKLVSISFLLPLMVPVAEAVSIEQQQKGMFGRLMPWPVLAVNAATLPDGRVISWSSHDNASVSITPANNPENTYTYVDIWDPDSNTHKRVDNTETNLFCAGQSFLADGRLFAAGGHDGLEGFVPLSDPDNPGSEEFVGKADANIFDWTSDSWVRVENMRQRRWYPTSISLPNGENFVIGGEEITFVKKARLTEVYQIDGKWRLLTGVDTEKIELGGGHPDFNHQYPYVHIVPKTGKVLVTGPSPYMAYIDPTGNGTLSWQGLWRDEHARQKGYSVHYRPHKVLVGGGYAGRQRALASTVIIDLSQAPSFPVTPGPVMHYPRTFANATILPDGKVFVNGGNTTGITFEDETAIFESEIWDPEINRWTLAATAAEPRTYHSTAVLLADGRVLTMGGGLCGNCVGKHGRNHLNAEIYLPPYLFKRDGSGERAVRPVIGNIPAVLTYGQQFSLRSGDAGNITKVSLLSLSSTTHGFSMDQRFMWLTILNRFANTLIVTAPKNNFVAPSGYYWLFILDKNGVPSRGTSVRIGA